MEISRLEALSDAIFGFAATLLVVALEVPNTFAQLRDNLNGFIGFAFSFAMLFMIWSAHNGFFRRYGLHDRGTTMLTAALLFVVLFYVYPLKFLCDLLGRALLVGFRAAGQGRISDWGDLQQLFLIYALGFVAVFVCLALLYRRAWTQRRVLELEPREEIEARMLFRHYLIFVGVGALSALLAFMGWGLAVGLPGWVFGLLGPLCWWNGVVGERAQRRVTLA